MTETVDAPEIMHFAMDLQNAESTAELNLLQQLKLRGAKCYVLQSSASLCAYE